MADEVLTSGSQKPRKWRDLGDNSWAPSVYNEAPAGGGGLTDEELRATPVPVSGTVSVSEPVTVDGEVALSAGTLTALETIQVGNFPASQPTTITKQDLAAAAPDDHTVTTSSTEAVAANANRKGCIIINVGTVKVSLGLDGNAAVLNKGITLGANGAWTMGEYDFTTGAVTAIADTGGSTLAIQEFS